jgi:hypothetical protein
MGSRDVRAQWLLVIAAVIAVAIAARTGPLVWSPLPATLDGFRYVRLAERLLATGHLPTAAIESDELVFTLVLAAGSQATGVAPLALAQPLVTATGAAGPLVGAALVARLTREREWPSRRRLAAVALTGFGLALDGIFLRRTGVPDEEAFGLALVPLAVIAAHRYLATGRRGWGGVTGLLVVALPPLHNLSSLVGVLSVTGLVALHATRAATTATATRALGLGAAAWVVFLGYFELAARLGLELTFSGLLRPYPALFIAWVIALVAGVVWVRSTTSRLQRLGLFLPVGGCFVVLVVNAVRPVFPGTIASPPLILALLFGFAIPVAFAVGGTPMMRRRSGLVVLATLVAPLVFIYYALSAALTPEFFSAVIRVQSYTHVPAFVLASVGVLAATQRVRATSLPGRRLLVGGLLVVFAVGVAVTLPLGYLNLDTGSAPSTTFPSEYRATGFATTHADGQFATDQNFGQLISNGHAPLARPQLDPTAGRATSAPTRTWLRGGPPPGCPLLSQQSWTRTGAHLYPAPPQTVAAPAYNRTLATRHVVYTTGGMDPVTLSLPAPGRTPTSC